MSLVFVLPFVLLCLLVSPARHGRRGAAMLAAVAWGVALTVITEALTLFRALDFAGLSVAWSATSLALLFVYVRRGGRPGADARLLVGRVRSEVGRLSLLPTSSLLLLAGLVLIVGAVGLNALAAAPNTYDSMTYHMARVAHWAQNRSVEHYPTHNLRQLYLTPWAEWAILHAQILSGGDRLANLAQWCSMVGSVAGVSLVAKQLGADAREQLLAAVVAATVPMGILQASGTQNDFVVTFWLVCFVYCLLLLRTQPRLPYALAAGASLGLALLTKGTAYVYATPFLIWLAVALYRKLRWRFWRPYLVVGALALLLNAGHYARNIDTFGSPLGVDRRGYVEAYKLANNIFTVPAFISNVVRNVSLHAGVPVVNRYASTAINRLHALLGLDVKDPRTTWPGITFQIPSLNTNEDMAGNPFHLALMLLSMALAYRWRGKDGRRDLLVYMLSVTAAFLLFCFYLRWQLWNSRLHLPLFVLWSPLVAAALTTIPHRRLTNAVAAALLLLSLPWVLFNTHRPLFKSHTLRTAESVLVTDRVDEYFNARPDAKDSYVRAAQLLASRNCSDIGLAIGGDDREYPLWVLLGAHAGAGGARLEHVRVSNLSAERYGRRPFDGFEPCAIFARKSAPAAESVSEDVQSYERVFESGNVQVFLKRQGL